jgi:hypothetical protein
MGYAQPNGHNPLTMGYAQPNGHNPLTMGYAQPNGHSPATTHYAQSGAVHGYNPSVPDRKDDTYGEFDYNPSAPHDSEDNVYDEHDLSDYY